MVVAEPAVGVQVVGEGARVFNMEGATKVGQNTSDELGKLQVRYLFSRLLNQSMSIYRIDHLSRVKERNETALFFRF